MCFWNIWDFPSSMIPHHFCCQWVLNAGRKHNVQWQVKGREKERRNKKHLYWARRMAANYWPTYFLFGCTINCAIKETRSRKTPKPLPLIVHMDMAKSKWCSVSCSLQSSNYNFVYFDNDRGNKRRRHKYLMPKWEIHLFEEWYRRWHYCYIMHYVCMYVYRYVCFSLLLYEYFFQFTCRIGWGTTLILIGC